MATLRITIGILCLAGLLGNRLHHRDLLNQQAQQKILNIARSQLDVRETGRNNYGKEIKAYLAYTHLPEGYSYCAAFVSWVFGKAGYAEPRTAWSPSLFPKNKIVREPVPADVLGIYYPSQKRIAHCGLVEQVHHDWIISIEANTNADGSNDGNGNYRKWRHRKTIYGFARWL